MPATSATWSSNPMGATASAAARAVSRPTAAVQRSRPTPAGHPRGPLRQSSNAPVCWSVGPSLPLGAICDLKLAVIGGSVALGFGEPFFGAVQSELDQRARLSFISGFRVVPVGLGQLAPLVGAAALARRAQGDFP